MRRSSHNPFKVTSSVLPSWPTTLQGSVLRASATPSSTLRLELVFTRTDNDNALAELTRILKRIASRHGW